MLNKVMLIGRLGRDPELRYTQNGTPVTTLSIATDESFIDREGNRVERTEWHRVSVFQRQAENCANYLVKGSLVYVEGSLQTRKWQDPQQPERICSSTEIRGQRVQFLDRRNAMGGAREGGYGKPMGDNGYRGQNDGYKGQDDGYSKPIDSYKGQDDGYAKPMDAYKNQDDGYAKPMGDGGYQKSRDYAKPAPRPYQSQQSRQNAPAQNQEPKEDLGPAFPSEVSSANMDEVPF